MDQPQSFQNGNGVSKNPLANSIPTLYGEVGAAVYRWVKTNPQRASLYSLGLGVVLGVTGLPRILVALQMARSIKSMLDEVE